MAEGLRVVVTNNVAVFRHLAAMPLQRLGVTYQVVADRTELMSAVKAEPPSVALIDVELAGGNGYEACRTIKDDPTLAGTRVALVLPPGRVDRAMIDRLAASGCDDVIAPPLTTDDFYAHLAQLTSLPLRRDRRIPVELDVELPGDDGGRATIAAQVTNVGAGGIGLRVATPLANGTRLAARLRVGDQHSPETRATVAWCRLADPSGLDEGEPAYVAGLAWDGEVPLRTRLLLEQVALFDVADEDDGAVTVLLHGDFTEMTRFEALVARLAGVKDVVFDLAAVRYISSAGVRAWCELLAELDGVKKRFRHCSIAFATQAAMVPLVLADGLVLSLEAPYYCEPCGRDEVRLLEVDAIAKDGDRLLPPKLTCGACGAATELDDLPERYFAFLAG